MNFNHNGEAEVTYDAIVVGSGISGGWAAKELCEKGLKVLLLERGREVVHVSDYPTTFSAPWELPHQGRPSQAQLKDQPKQNRTGYTTQEGHAHFFVKDTEHPYIEKKRFDWMRGYHKGGRSLTWGRQSYRFSQMDFEANEKDGIATPWPVNYADIAPWYSYAERFAGISGSKEGLPQLPDGEFLPAMDLTAGEKAFKKAVEAKWSGRKVIPGRVAHLTKPTEEQLALGRGQCQYRNLCMRGCPYGAYFSSQSATLPAAAKTGNLTLRTNSIVGSLIYDDDKGRAKGVNVVDQITGQSMEFFAKIIFLNASCLPSTAIVMNTQSKRFGNKGLDESGALGGYLMDHHLNVGAGGTFEGDLDKTTFGRRPNGFYIPRYRNLHETGKDYLRGFGYQGGAFRQTWDRDIEGFGTDFKKKMASHGPWSFWVGGFGEWLPYEQNRMSLSPDQKDKWGLPQIVVDAGYGNNEVNMRKDMENDAKEMLQAMGAATVYGFNSDPALGLGIHEMGTMRMGTSSKNSVLNKFNQLWAAPNVFNTDGGFMTSAACVNPSLTYMAFTARAANHAVEELKKGNL
jgi:choline dehydrogenase-like flavoprotein